MSYCNIQSDHMRVANVLDATAKVRTFVQDEKYPDVERAFNAIVDALILFGKCEMAFQSIDKKRLEGSARDNAVRRAERYQSRGLRSVSDAMESLSELREQGPFEDVELSAEDEDVAYFIDEFRHSLGDVNLKPSDIDKINGVFERAVESVLENQVDGLVSFTLGQLEELREARRSDDRGVRENIPWWKLVAIAAFIGVGVWYLIRCKWSWRRGWRCSQKEELIYAIVASAAVAGINLC